MNGDEIPAEYPERVRGALGRRAAQVDAQPDPVELTDRIGTRERRRTRVLSAALVLALFAGPLLGFVAGRNRDGTSDTGIAAREQSGDDDGGGGGGTVESTLAPEAGGVPPGSGSTGYETYPDGAISRLNVTPPIGLAFVRDAGKVKIRVFRGSYGAGPTTGPSWWEPPAWCFAEAFVQADVSTDDAVGVVTGDVYRELRDAVTGGSLGAIGVAEGAPTWVAIVQAPAGATRVHATFPGDESDEMEPVDGVAVLVAPAAIDPRSQDDLTAAIEAFGADGQSLGTGTARNDGFRPDLGGQECQAPTGLPAPGPEQPSDVESARAAVVAAVEVAYGNDQPDAARMAAIDDPTGLPQIWEQNRNGPYGEQIAASVITVDDVVFASPTAAYVQYHWDSPGYGTYGARFGEVRFADGTWKVTRAMICADIQLSGVSCP